MKKIFATLALCVMTIAASAQVKSIDIKGDLRHDFGLGVGATFGIVDKIDLAPSFNYYFVDGGHMLTVDADFHYNFDISDTGFTLYPVAGVTLGNWGVKGGDSSTKIGFDLGGGVRYNVINNLSIFCEAKWQWYSHYDDAYVSLGVNIGI